MSARGRDTTQTELRAAREALSRADYWLRAARADLARSDMVDGIDALDISVRRITTAQDAMRRAMPTNGETAR